VAQPRWLPPGGFFFSLPLLFVGFLIPDVNTATVLLMIGTAAQLCYFGPAFALLHAAAEPRMRATAIAVVLLMTTWWVMEWVLRSSER